MKDPSMDGVPNCSSNKVNGHGILKIIKEIINAKAQKCTSLNFLLLRINPIGKPKTI